MTIFKRSNSLFLITVFFPTLLAIIYYGVIASDVYISTSSFVVRSSQQSSTNLLGEMFKGSMFAPPQNDDAYTVESYILSEDSLKGLENDFHLKQLYSDHSIDFISRFHGIDFDNSMENFYRYYEKRIVDVQLESESSIITLTVRAFSAKDAYGINKRLLEMSEALVNQLNERSQQDTIKFARKEVEEEEEVAKDAAIKLEQYRNQKGVIDPEKESVIPLQEVGKLKDELVATKSEAAQLETLAPNNPMLPTLKQRVTLLEREIEKESKHVAGSEDHSLASKATEFQRLELEKEFAEKMLASAMTSFEEARDEAQRQQQYIERIAQPSEPDVAMEPRRLRSIATVFFLGLVGWGILSMLIAGIKEHQD